MVERVVEIADAVVDHVNALRTYHLEQTGQAENSSASSSSTTTNPEIPAPLTTKMVLEGIHYYRIHDYVEQVALVNILPSFLDTHPQVR